MSDDRSSNALTGQNEQSTNQPYSQHQSADTSSGQIKASTHCADDADDIPHPGAQAHHKPWDLTLLAHWCEACDHASYPTADGVRWCLHREECRAAMVMPPHFRPRRD